MRRYLDRNKVFFETVAASLLSLMAIIVSVVQIGLAIKQNKLTQMQTEIARTQALPQFVVSLKQIYDPTAEKYTEDQIVATSQGGLVQELDCNFAVFIDTSYFVHAAPRQKQLPLDGYYNSIFLTGEGSGKVVTLKGINNDERFSQLTSQIRELAQAKGVMCNVELKRYIRLRYRDVFGEKHVKYYYVPPIFGGSVLDENEGKSIFDRYEQGFTDSSMLKWESLNAQTIIGRMEQ